MLEARTLPLGPPDGPDAVAILNPLAADEAHLRRRLLPGLVRRAGHKWGHRHGAGGRFSGGGGVCLAAGGGGGGAGAPAPSPPHAQGTPRRWDPTPPPRA